MNSEGRKQDEERKSRVVLEFTITEMNLGLRPQESPLYGSA